ncbi:MAG: hypothetical protein MK207_15790 [Saprospiraceae bacterium]|nr:hypothetical protein [Saprospiraceae bacterium]
MKLICQKCKAIILHENVNISSDLAKCDRCNSIHKASDLADSNSIYNINNPPNGTKIIIKKQLDGSTVLFYPKQGFKVSMIFPIFFTVLWLSFIAFWTRGASGASILFAMCSIPFWVAGFGMLSGVINLIFETQTLKLSKTSLTIKKDKPIRPKKFEINIKDIESIRMENLKIKNDLSMFGNMNLLFKAQKSSGMEGIEIPAIVSGVMTEYFFEYANETEQEWVTSTLDNMVKMMNN